MRRSRPRNIAFTLVELLVVIGIIALLISILLPALNSARRSANSVKCAAALREIGSCFKMYEIESKGYYPVGRINGWKKASVTGPYNIDGIDYPTATPAGGQAYWFTFLAKFATKGKVGAGVGTDAGAAELSRRTIFFGCPSWEGYRAGGVVAGDINVVQPGYGMNVYPTITNTYAGTYPAAAASAVHDTAEATPGNFLRGKAWTKPAERMLVADSKLWLSVSGKPAAAASYPACVVAQPVLANSTAGLGDTLGASPTQTLVDIYRHGSFPPLNGNNYSISGGRINYNILYADGHVTTSTLGSEAYKSFRMRFPVQ